MSFTYKTGPDGKNYAVAGEVGIDTSPVNGDPQATIEKARVIQRAALAPAEPSAQDYRVAQSAVQMMAQATIELRQTENTLETDSNTEQRSVRDTEITTSQQDTPENQNTQINQANAARQQFDLRLQVSSQF